MYTYNAKVLQVIDGDTYDLSVDLGFSLNIKIRVRLNGIDTPETTWRAKNEEEKERGIAAKSFVESLVLEKEVTIKSHYLGVYGRYIVDIFLPDSSSLRDVLVENNFEKGFCQKTV